MLTSQPEQSRKVRAYKYIYGAGLLSGICFTFVGLSALATIRADHVTANLFLGSAGLVIMLMGLLLLSIIYRLRHRLLTAQRESELRIFWTPLILLPLAIGCEGLALFSQNILPLLLGTSSFVPSVISLLLMGGGMVLILLLFNRLGPLYERMKQIQTTSDQSRASEE